MTESVEDKIELAEATDGSLPVEDRRPRMPKPILVRLIAVEGAHLYTTADVLSDLDWFYRDLLQFQAESQKSANVYRAENVRLHIHIVQVPPERHDFRPLGIEVPSLIDTEHLLVENEIEFEIQKSLTPGHRKLLLLDPAGNWVELTEAPPVR